MPVPGTPDLIGDDAEDHDDHPRQDHGMGDVLGRRCAAQGVQGDVENEPDARKLADSVKAARADRYQGWASQCAFALDAASVDALASGLPLLRRRGPQTSGH